MTPIKNNPILAAFHESEEDFQFFCECVMGSGDKYDTPEKYQAGFEAWLKEKGIEY